LPYIVPSFATLICTPLDLHGPYFMSNLLLGYIFFFFYESYVSYLIIVPSLYYFIKLFSHVCTFSCNEWNQRL